MSIRTGRPEASSSARVRASRVNGQLAASTMTPAAIAPTKISPLIHSHFDIGRCAAGGDCSMSTPNYRQFECRNQPPLCTFLKSERIDEEERNQMNVRFRSQLVAVDGLTALAGSGSWVPDVMAHGSGRSCPVHVKVVHAKINSWTTTSFYRSRKPSAPTGPKPYSIC